MDALSDVLRTMRLKGGLFLHGQFADPWCVSVKVLPESWAPYLGQTAFIIPYHFVLEGRLLVRMDDGLEFAMESGESILFPRNDRHLMGSDLDRTPVLSEDIVQRSADGLATIVIDGSGAPTRIVCGFLGAENVNGNPITSALPAVLRLDSRDGSAADWIRSTFRYAAEQIAAGRTGSEAIMGKLSELLFVEAIQRYTETLTDKQTGWLAGLADPYVSRAMALMHRRIAEPWTVDALGREVGLSRSALAERFVHLLGMPPMAYLANWRIHVAAHELINSGKPILQIAQEVGYDSEASFTRAFKRLLGTPPATWRRQRR